MIRNNVREVKSVMRLAAVCFVLFGQMKILRLLYSSVSSPSSSSSSSSTTASHLLVQEEIKQKDDNSSPPKEQQQQQHAGNIIPPTCQFNDVANRTINRIFVLHMRKAGGSSIRDYFKDVAKAHGIEFKAAEGYLFPEQPGANDTTLYITHIREPIARAISHYKYEKRWECGKQLQQEGFVPQANNTYMSLYNFSQGVFRPRSKLWTCASNCYARWSTGRPYYAEMLKDPNALEQAAYHTLYNYNLIVVSEWLKDEDYLQSLESIFGVPRLNRTKGMQCGKLTKQANGMVPLVVEQRDLDALQGVNRIDTALYHDLTQCKPNFRNWTIRWGNNK